MTHYEIIGLIGGLILAAMVFYTIYRMHIDEIPDL